MRQYWAVIYKGNRVGPLWIERYTAQAYANVTYGKNNPDIEIQLWWE